MLYAVQRRLRPGYGRLVLLWLALTSAQTGFGYFIIAAVVPVGDTGRAFEAWGVPTAGYLAAAALGVVGQLGLSALTARELSPWFARTTDVRRWVLLPWVLGSVLLVVVYAVVAVGDLPPEVVVAVLAGVATSAVFMPTTTFFLRRSACLGQVVPLGSPVPAVVGAVAVVAAVALQAAVGGITLG